LISAEPLYVIKIVRHETSGFGQELARSVGPLKRMPLTSADDCWRAKIAESRESEVRE
jgi:hypothetical protein